MKLCFSLPAVVQYQQYHKQGALEPLVLRCRILAPYVPLRATSSESVPGIDIVDIAQLDFENMEFRNYLKFINTIIILLFLHNFN